MTLQEIFDFIKDQKLAVISTVDENSVPESAIVEFGEYGEFNLVIDTFTHSRKYQNLIKNSEAAFVIGWDDDITIQINATTHLLEGEELNQAKESYFAKNPRAKKWDNREEVAYFGFMPKWIRYSDVGMDPWHIEEFEL